MNKEDFCITGNYTLLDAIDAIQSNRNRGAIVVNEDNKVVGYISQGDVLQAIVSGISLYSPIGGIMKSGFMYSTERDLKKLVPVFKQKLITIMPIVDNEFNLIDVITLKDILELINN